MTLEERVKILEQLVASIADPTSAFLKFNKNIALRDTVNIQLSTTTGSQIGTSSTQKLAFFGKTPVVRQSSVTPATSAGATYDQTQAQSVVTAVNAILAANQNYGLLP